MLPHTFAGPKTVLVQCSLVARLSLLPGNEAKYSGSILCVYLSLEKTERSFRVTK